MRFFHSCLFLICFSCLSDVHNLQEAEYEALNCINSKLLAIDMNIDSLLNDADELNQIIVAEDVDLLEKKNQEMDSIFTLCGIFKDNHLNLKFLINCMEPNYHKDFDSLSYGLLLEHFKYLDSNPDIMYDLSPILHLEALNYAISPELANKKFYSVIRFIFFQGVMKEPRSQFKEQNK